MIGLFKRFLILVFSLIAFLCCFSFADTRIYAEDSSGEYIDNNGIKYDFTSKYIFDADCGFIIEVPNLTKIYTVEEELADNTLCKIDFPVLLQNPYFPTGCESTSLTNVLNFCGFTTDTGNIVNNYLDCGYDRLDFRKYFIGWPYYDSGYGCYAPCIIRAATEYLNDQNSSLKAVDYSGYVFESLLNEVNKGNPVIIWVTIRMKSPFYDLTLNITGDDGKALRWKCREHCMVLYGYDIDKNIAYVMDPLAGNVTYDLTVLKNRYMQMDRQAVIIKDPVKDKLPKRDLFRTQFLNKFLPKYN